MSQSRASCAAQRMPTANKFTGGDAQKALKGTFDFFDVDQSGSIDTGELHKALMQLNLKVTQAQCAKILAVIDSDGNGTVEFSEFKTFFEKCGSAEDIENLLAAQHKRFFKYRESVQDADFSKIYPNPRRLKICEDGLKEAAHEDSITGVTALTGNKFATCSVDGQVLFWKWENKTLIELDHEIQHKDSSGHAIGVTAICPLQDCTIMATAAANTVYLWKTEADNKLADGTQLGEYTFEEGQQPLCLDQRGGSQLVVGLLSGHVAVLNCADPTEITAAFELFPIHVAGKNASFHVNSVACHGNLIASAGSDSNVVVFDPVKRTANPTKSVAKFDGIGADFPICHIKWHTGGKKLFIASEDYTCKMVDIDQGPDVQSSFLGHTNLCTAVAISPNGERLLTGAQDGVLRTWLVNEMEIVTVNYKQAKAQREMNPGSVSDAEFKMIKSIWRERSTLKCVQAIGEWCIGAGTAAIPHYGVAWCNEDWAVAVDKAGNIAVLDCTGLAGQADIKLWDEHSETGQ